jgi:hypothetical protein
MERSIMEQNCDHDKVRPIQQWNKHHDTTNVNLHIVPPYGNLTRI